MTALAKSWSQLETLASRGDLTMFRSPGGVTVYDGSVSLLTITGGMDDTITDADLDATIRVALEPALVRLAEVVAKYDGG